MQGWCSSCGLDVSGCVCGWWRPSRTLTTNLKILWLPRGFEDPCIVFHYGTYILRHFKTYQFSHWYSHPKNVSNWKITHTVLFSFLVTSCCPWNFLETCYLKSITAVSQCTIRTPLFLWKKIFFLSFHDLGSCKSLEGDRWVVRGTSALHLNEPTWIIDGSNELIVDFLFALVLFLDSTQPQPFKNKKQIFFPIATPNQTQAIITAAFICCFIQMQGWCSSWIIHQNIV